MTVNMNDLMTIAFTDPRPLKCYVCRAKDATMNYPFDHFTLAPFGSIEMQQFALCDVCQHLFKDKFFNTLVIMLTQNPECKFKDFRTAYRNCTFLMVVLNEFTKAKRN